MTTTRITHASPSGLWAHTPERDWESDAQVPLDENGIPVCDDIAKQLILNEPGKSFNILMGGGRANFIPADQNDPEEGKGNRKDGADLIKVWTDGKARQNVSHAFVWNRDQLLALNDTPTDILGTI